MSSCYHSSKFLDLNNLSSQQQPFVLLNDGSEVRSSISVRLSAKTRLISSNPSTKPVGLGLTDLWNISRQNRSPRWPQFCFPRPQNKLAKSTHTSKVTSTFILALFKPGSTSGIISTHSLIGNLLQKSSRVFFSTYGPVTASHSFQPRDPQRFVRAEQ